MDPNLSQSLIAPNLPSPLDPLNPAGTQPAPTTLESYHSGLVRPPIPPELPNTDEFERTIAKPTVEFGQSGTLIFQGIITLEDYNADLTGRKGMDIFDEMRRSDGTVRAALQVCKLPIISTDWRIDPASEDAQDLLIAEFITEQLFTNLNWKQTLRELLLEFDFGFSVAELIYKTVQFQGKTLIGLDRLATRKQKTVFSWITQFNQRGITQIVPSGGTLSIPREKLLILTHEQEGDNYAGLSLLRAAYKHWYLKKGIERVDAIAIERQGVGILKVITPPAASDDDRNKAREAARNVRANEEAFLEAPQGFDFDFADMHANTLRSPTESMLYHDRQIMKSVLAQFLELGATTRGGGSRALSEDHSQLFIQSLEAEAHNIAEAVHRDVIARLVRLNFGTKAKCPKISFASLGSPDMQALSAAINLFVTNKTITTGFQDEQYVRTLMNMPLRDEDEVAVEDFKDKLDRILPTIGALGQLAQVPAPLPGVVVKPDENDPSYAAEPAQPSLDNARPERPAVVPVIDTSGADAKDQLRQFIRDLQITIATRELAGEPITKEEVLLFELQLLEKQQAVETEAYSNKPDLSVVQTAPQQASLDDALRQASAMMEEVSDYAHFIKSERHSRKVS